MKLSPVCLCIALGSAGMTFGAEPSRIAVLAFQGAPSAPAVNAALATEVAHSLYRIPGLVVQRKPSQETDWILRGELVRSDEQAGVSFRLTTFPGDYEVLSGTESVPSGSLSMLAQRVAARVAAAVMPTAAPVRLPRSEPVGADLYASYLEALGSAAGLEERIRLATPAGEGTDYAPAVMLLGSLHLDRAGELGGRGHYYDLAESALTRAFEIDPAYPPAREKLASYYAKKGKSEKALRLMLDGLDSHPTWSGFEKTLGYVTRYAGLMEESVSAYGRAQGLDPGLSNAISTQDQITKSFIYQGNYQKALASHRKMHEFLEEAGRSIDEKQFFYEGVIHLYAGDATLAVAAFERGASVDPDSVWTTFGRAYQGMVQGDGQRVASVLDELEERIVVDGERHYRLVHFSAHLGRLESAIRHLSQSIDSGFFNAPYMRSDPLLRDLHGHADYEALVEKAHERHLRFRDLVSEN